MKQYSGKLKLISSILVHTFILQQISYAAPELKPLDIRLSEAKPAIHFSLPESVATIDDSWKSPVKDAKTLVLFQDAHTNDSGQINLAKAMDAVLSSEKSIQFVFTEAALGDNSLTYMKSQASAGKRKEVSMAYIRKGLLHGDEYLNLTSARAFTIWGVENPEVYAESLENYKKVAANREKFQSYLSSIDQTINTLKQTTLNPALFKFYEKYEAFKDEKISLTDYFDSLLVKSQSLNIPLKNYPHLETLKKLKDKEASIDFKKANEEEQKAIQSLSKEEQDELKGLAENLARSPFKIGSEDKKEDKAFYSFLEEKLAGNHTPESYAELAKYFDYLKIAKSIDIKVLLNEVESLGDAVVDGLSVSADEKDLIHCAKTTRYLHKLFNLTLTPEDYDDYKALTADFPISKLTGFLNKKIMSLKKYYERALFLEEGYDGIVRDSESFYELTFKRDSHFIDEAVSKMSAEKQSEAILITGGFHSANLKSLLKKNNISYISVVPQVFHETNQKRYEDILLNQTKSQSKVPVLSSSYAGTMRTPAAASDGVNFPAIWVNKQLLKDAISAELKAEQNPPLQTTPFNAPQTTRPGTTVVTPVAQPVRQESLYTLAGARFAVDTQNLEPQEELRRLEVFLTELEKERSTPYSGNFPRLSVISDQHGTIEKFDSLILDSILGSLIHDLEQINTTNSHREESFATALEAIQDLRLFLASDHTRTLDEIFGVLQDYEVNPSEQIILHNNVGALRDLFERGKLELRFTLDPDRTLNSQLSEHGVNLAQLKGKVYFHNLGDLMDRGQYGIKVYRRSKELIEAGLSDFVLGNHDLWEMMNLWGFHLPWYRNFNFYGYTDEFDQKYGSVENVLEAYHNDTSDEGRKTHGMSWWADKLASFNEHQALAQKTQWAALDEIVNGKIDTANPKKRVQGTGLFYQASTSMNDDQIELWGKFRGYNPKTKIDVYTGIRAVGYVSLKWWQNLSIRFKEEYRKIDPSGESDKPSDEAWRKAIELIDTQIIPYLQKDIEAQVEQGNKWWRIFEAINYYNYSTPEWWAKDWSSHKDWGTAVIDELNEGIQPTDKRYVTQANYLDNTVLQDISSFFRQHFYLYTRDIYQNTYMHAWAPVDKNTGEFYFTYKGVEYRGKGSASHPSFWEGLDKVSADVRNEENSLSDIYEALYLVNYWYADNTTQSKVPDVAYVINKFGAEHIAEVNGFNRLFTGHLPFYEFNKLSPEKRGVINSFRTDDAGKIIFTDHGMGKRFGGRGGRIFVGVSLNLRGYEHNDSKSIATDPRTAETQTSLDGASVEVPIFNNPGIPRAEFLTRLISEVNARIAELKKTIHSSDLADEEAAKKREKIRILWGDLARVQQAILYSQPDEKEQLTAQYTRIKDDLRRLGEKVEGSRLAESQPIQEGDSVRPIASEQGNENVKDLSSVNADKIRAAWGELARAQQAMIYSQGAEKAARQAEIDKIREKLRSLGEKMSGARLTRGEFVRLAEEQGFRVAGDTDEDTIVISQPYKDEDSKKIIYFKASDLNSRSFRLTSIEYVNGTLIATFKAPASGARFSEPELALADAYSILARRPWGQGYFVYVKSLQRVSQGTASHVEISARVTTPESQTTNERFTLKADVNDAPGIVAAFRDSLSEFLANRKSALPDDQRQLLSKWIYEAGNQPVPGARLSSAAEEGERTAATVTDEDFRELLRLREQGLAGFHKNIDPRPVVPASESAVLDWARLTEQEKQKYKDAQRDMFSRGEIGMIVMAGGEATRFGGPKTFVEVSPELGEFLQIKADNLRWLNQTYGTHIPLYVLSSEKRLPEFKQSLAQRQYYGLSANDFLWYTQGTVDTFIPSDQEIEANFKGGDVEKNKTYAHNLRQANPDGIYRFNGERRKIPAGHLDAIASFVISGRLSDSLKRGLKYAVVVNIDNLQALLKDDGVIAHFAGTQKDFAFLLAEKNLTFTITDKASGKTIVDKLIVRFRDNVVSFDGLTEFTGQAEKDGYRYVINPSTKQVDVFDIASGNAVETVQKIKPETGGTLVQPVDESGNPSGKPTMKEGFELKSDFPHADAPFFNTNTILLNLESLLRILGVTKEELLQMTFEQRSQLVREKLVKTIKPNFEFKNHEVEGEYPQFGPVKDGKTKIPVSQLTRIMLQVAHIHGADIEYYFLPRQEVFAPVKEPEDKAIAAANNRESLKAITLQSGAPSSAVTSPDDAERLAIRSALSLKLRELATEKPELSKETRALADKLTNKATLAVIQEAQKFIDENSGARLANLNRDEAVLFVSNVVKETGKTGSLALSADKQEYVLQVRISDDGKTLYLEGLGDRIEIRDFKALAVKEGKAQVSVSLQDLKLALDRTDRAAELLNQSNKENFYTKPALVYIPLESWFNKETTPAKDYLIPIFAAYLHKLHGEKLGKTAGFVLQHENKNLVKEILDYSAVHYGQEESFVFAEGDKLPEYLKEAQKANVVAVHEDSTSPVKSGERNLPVKALTQNEMPNFASLKLALFQARIDEISTNDPDFMTLKNVYKDMLGHEISNLDELIKVLNGQTTALSALKQWALPPIVKVAVESAIQMYEMMRRMAEQAA